MFGGGRDKEALAKAQQELAQKERELREKADQLQREQERAADAERTRSELQAARDELERKQAAQVSELQESREQVAEQSEHLAEQREQIASEFSAYSELDSQFVEARRQYAESEFACEEEQQAKLRAETQLRDSEQQAEKMRSKIQSQSRMLEAEQKDKASAHAFLDVAVGECEFASAFAYSIVVQLQGQSEARSTDISAPSARPVFSNASMLLPADLDVTDDSLHVSAYATIEDPVAVGAAPTTRLLGDATISLAELQVAEGGTASRRVVRNISFVRAAGTEAASKQLTVGRATVAVQVKVLTHSEVAAKGGTLAEPLPASFPSLDKSLWTTTPMQHRLRVLVHRAEMLPAPPSSGRATARIALRLVCADGQVLYESLSTDVPVEPSGETSATADVIFAQELVLPLHTSEQKDPQAQLTLEMVSASEPSSGTTVTTASLLDLRWLPEVMPVLNPLHLNARPSETSSSAPSFARPRPVLLVSIMREPPREDLDSLGDAAAHGVEVRFHGVPAARPLPDPVNSALIAITPDSQGTDTSAADLQIPVATFYYDQRLDLGTVIASHFRSGAGQSQKYFLTPAVGSSRTPQWGQFTTRFLASPACLGSLTMLLFDGSSTRADPDHPFGNSVLGFATLDARTLCQASAGDMPLQRSFLLDLRLLEAPGTASSLEVECRVWPRGTAAWAQDAPVKSSPVVTNVPRGVEQGQAAGQLPIGTPGPISGSNGAALAVADGGALASLQHEANEFRLNHELSVQLAKEFNMRAAALKRAGAEIVNLRRQVQMLKSENANLKAQLEDEEKLAEEVRKRPPPEGFDQLSSSELALKLQRALDKYRDEKTKGAELERRLGEALREASRARGLERTFEELETAHLEQNKELQRLQEDNRKIDGYKQAARAQEKVIAKLEKILEGSLQEVQKAQRVQVDMERLKTEKLRLQEKCSQLIAKRKGVAEGEEGTNELRRQVAEKNREVARLEAVVQELRRGRTPEALPSPTSPELQQEQKRLQELEDSRLEWEQRCMAAEHRIQTLQQQLKEASRRYGGEISSLKVEIAKRDARVLELEFLLKEREGGDGATVAAGLGAAGLR